MPRYIDADAFIKEQCNSCDGYCEKVDCDCLSCDKPYQCGVIQELKNAPTISPDEVRGVGKWIERVDYDWDIYHECSVCHTPFTMLDGTTPELNDYHYCPNCGARLTVGEND